MGTREKELEGDAESPQPDPVEWLSLEQQADKLHQVESFDGMAGLRHALRHLAGERGHWAGIPMPLDDIDLIIEPSYPYAGLSRQSKDKDVEGVKFRNRFWSTKYKSDFIVGEVDGKIRAAPVNGTANKATAEFNTVLAADAWGIEQESRALRLLATLVPHRIFKQYLLTGMFFQTSKRSAVTYMFRRLKPTLALRAAGDHIRILCGMCMHPIGYYEGSWAGAMCPTDDVVAHLMMMRGDEVMFWRRCNQHSPTHPLCGV